MEGECKKEEYWDDGGVLENWGRLRKEELG